MRLARATVSGSCSISLREAQSHQASVALFIEWIEAQPAGHGLDGALPIPRPFVQQRQDIKELVNAQVPVLAVLACSSCASNASCAWPASGSIPRPTCLLADSTRRRSRMSGLP